VDESGVLDDACVAVVVVVVVRLAVAVGVAGLVVVDKVGVGEAGRNLEPKPRHDLLKLRLAFATRHGVRDRRLLVDVLLASGARERGGVTVCYKSCKVRKTVL
jgi:glutamate mutase epsilon subunit